MYWMFKRLKPGGMADNFIKNKECFNIDEDGRVTLRMDNEQTIKAIQEQIKKLKHINVGKKTSSKM